MNEARPDQTAEVTSIGSAPVSRSARHRVVLDVAQAVRATHGSNDVLIAVCSAMRAAALREIERHTKTRGINLFLSKPLTNETLIGLLPRLEALRPC